jgi:rSAM/selenodomain-associated transferase 1
MPDHPGLRLCIFARTPEIGRVKRRLAVDIGDEAALAAHVHLVERTLDECLSPDWVSELWLADSLDDVQARCWGDEYSVPLRAQQGADLGERMHHALTVSLAEAEKAVLIGCDCPEIDRNYVQQSFEALSASDVVIGPAADGGYGLIGLNASCGVLFENVTWGSASVLSETLSRAADEGLKIHLLDGIYDVDTVADWRRYETERL